MPLAQLSAGFQSLPLLPTIKLGPSGADSWVSGLVYILGPHGPLQRTNLWGWEFLLLLQPPQNFSVRGLRLYFLALEPWVASLSHSPVVLPSLSSPAATSLRVLSTPAARLHPSYLLDECFFFNSLVVRLPYSLIFCQFWLFFCFKFVVVLPLVVWGGTVCLFMPPSWTEVSVFF